MDSSAQLYRVAAFLLSCVLLFLSAVEAQPGFLSLDCGLLEGNEYVENSTGISYISDSKYVEGGQPKTVIADGFAKRYQTLRVFPEGDRNCYNLQPLLAGDKYLVRSAFFYGNYDGLASPPEFELYTGANAKLTVVLSLNESSLFEVVAVANGGRIWVCLVNTGKGTPLISAIQLRRLPNTIYPANASQSLFLQRRSNFGSEIVLRYPDDPYDRIWSPVTGSSVINFSSPVVTRSEDGIRVPSVVMETAVTVPNVSFILFYPIAFGLPTDTIFFALHFAELRNLSGSNETRSINIYGEGRKTVSLTNYTPKYLLASHVYGEDLEVGPTFLYNISLIASNMSTLPPFINALESFRVLKSELQPTDLADVGAVEDIKEAYRIVRNWQGDPCVPKDYLWDGLSCSYGSEAARIVSLNLSSSGITGEIPSSIVNLTALTSLDWSNNQISTKTLDLLAKLPSLESLNLSGIKILGSSQDFCSKALSGTLSSKIQGLKAVCSPSPPPSPTPISKQGSSSVSNKQNYFVSIIMVLILSLAM